MTDWEQERQFDLLVQHSDEVASLRAEIKKMRSEIEGLRGTLREVANLDSHSGFCGDIARRALEETP